MYNYEMDVVLQILELEVPQFSRLLDQAKTLLIESKKTNAVGFYVNFSLSKEKVCLECPSKRLGNSINGCIGDESVLVGFVLYVDNGLITTLEGYTYGNELWPTDDNLKFITGDDLNPFCHQY